MTTQQHLNAIKETALEFWEEKKKKTIKIIYIPEVQYDEILEAYEKGHYAFCRLKRKDGGMCHSLQFLEKVSGDIEISINKGGDISENIILKKVNPSFDFFFCV